MDEQLDQLVLRVRPEMLPGGDRESTLRLLADELTASMPELDSSAFVMDDAWERELVEPTYIGMGLAVPHARVRGLSRAGLYMGFNQAGIPWPHEEAHFIALLVVPWEAPEMHLQLLARLVRWRKNLTEAEACALAESPDKWTVALDDAFLDLL